MKKFSFLKILIILDLRIFSAFIRIKIIRSLLTKIDFSRQNLLKIFFWQFADVLKKEI